MARRASPKIGTTTGASLSVNAGNTAAMRAKCPVLSARSASFQIPIARAVGSSITCTHPVLSGKLTVDEVNDCMAGLYDTFAEMLEANNIEIPDRNKR